MSYSSKIHIRADYRKLTPTHDNILVTDMEFEDRVSKGGIILPNDNMEERGIRPRWCKVVAVGHENQDVKPGEWIYVAHGRWTRGIDMTDPETDETMTIRLVDPKDVLLSADKRLDDDTVGLSHSYRP
jgi:co-chaperonin GroES (HSP10)